MSNFDWTDKNSVKWFLLLPEGHQGPYSLENLYQLNDQKKIPKNVKIWAEGLASPSELNEAFINSGLMLPLPPLPDDELPPLPADEHPHFVPEEIVEEVKPEKKYKSYIVLGLVVTGLLLFGFIQFSKSKEIVKIYREPKMTLELQNRIETENSFDGWGKKLFFKEYVPQDHSLIWMATSSFQQCDVEANFNAVPGKLLSLKDEKISFRSKGRLENHLVEFSKLDFASGQKIIPGLYEVDITATHCEWEGMIPKLMNLFNEPESDYMARIKVILFSRGPVEFNRNLDALLKKKMEVSVREKSESELFWQDMQQKLETLEAISLQIEQHFLDHVQSRPDLFIRNLKIMIDEYTKKYGSFLTSFVVENENYFKTLKGDSHQRNYELTVRIMSKKIGLESMKYIEEFQGIKKKPTDKDLEKISDRIKKSFAYLKHEIRQKISQVAADRLK